MSYVLSTPAVTSALLTVSIWPWFVAIALTVPFGARLLVGGEHAVVPVGIAQQLGDVLAPAGARFHAGIALDLVGRPRAILGCDRRATRVGLRRRVDDDDHAAVRHLLAGLDRGEADRV